LKPGTCSTHLHKKLQLRSMALRKTELSLAFKDRFSFLSLL
jgi:hypothetical protein